MRILIVDDDYITRTQLKLLVAEYGDYDTVPNGELALKFFKIANEEEVPYDLITMDINMPDMRGQDVVSNIRDWEKSHQKEQVPIVMVTAMDDASSFATSFAGGCHEYLVKPVTADNLRKVLGHIGFKPANSEY